MRDFTVNPDLVFANSLAVRRDFGFERTRGDIPTLRRVKQGEKPRRKWKSQGGSGSKDVNGT